MLRTSLDHRPDNILDNRGRGSVGWHWPAIHREGRKFGAVVGLVAAVAFAFGLGWLGWPLAVLTVCVCAFFRDPLRVTPLTPGAIVAPADGLVTAIVRMVPPRELTIDDGSGVALADAEAVRISIFMSVFDVHINRAPVGGTVRRVVYIPGRFHAADLDKASEENERQHILIEADGVGSGGAGPGGGLVIGFTQIAGLVARRIVPFVKPGDIIAAGQRIGLIRFGSRVDVFLPAGSEPLVLMGQKIVAGETVLAVAGEGRLIEGITQ